MENITITPMYAGLLGIVLLILSIRVVAVIRAKGKVLYGDGGNREFTPVLRSQANFVEYVPMIVILIAFAEAGGTSAGWVHAMGAGLLVGRIVHPLGMTHNPGVNPLRFIGTNLTWLALLAASVCVLTNQFGD
jgi:uncharacterized membrane protein YecN with MAPEG domain